MRAAVQLKLAHSQTELSLSFLLISFLHLRRNGITSFVKHSKSDLAIANMWNKTFLEFYPVVTRIKRFMKATSIMAAIRKMT